jgi:Tfp pilus assembly protein PilF
MMPNAAQAPLPAVASPGASRQHQRIAPAGITGAALLPAVLLCIAIMATACGSGGSPSPSATASSDISHGLAAKSAGQTQQAIHDFKAAVSAEPTDPIPYYDLGVIYQQVENDTSQAAAYYGKAVLADSNYRPALFNLAIIDTSTDPGAAINLYNQLLKINPDDSNVLFNLGLLLHSQGQTTEGQADVSKAVFLSPSLKSRIPANSGITP